ncbi:MAG: nucleotidyltransferase domain-containing protein [Elusimicrobia bacterium]|nr:nucleotidyltransferase domain-containing protein [Elusimicrobiota bacterium]
MIDLEKKYLDEVLHILAEHVPRFEVRAFGSRINGTAKKNSDLDLAVMADKNCGWDNLSELKLAFSQSDLPIIIDVLDWRYISDEFKKIIEAKHEVIHTPQR